MFTPRSSSSRSITQALAWLLQRLNHRPSLHDLDDGTLRDIGVHRSEIGSIEAESRAGRGQATRLRIVARQPV